MTDDATRERCLERFQRWTGIEMNRILWQEGLKVRSRKRPKCFKPLPLRLRFDAPVEDEEE